MDKNIFPPLEAGVVFSCAEAFEACLLLDLPSKDMKGDQKESEGKGVNYFPFIAPDEQYTL